MELRVVDQLLVMNLDEIHGDNRVPVGHQAAEVDARRAEDLPIEHSPIPEERVRVRNDVRKDPGEVHHVHREAQVVRVVETAITLRGLTLEDLLIKTEA